MILVLAARLEVSQSTRSYDIPVPRYPGTRVPGYPGALKLVKGLAYRSTRVGRSQAPTRVSPVAQLGKFECKNIFLSSKLIKSVELPEVNGWFLTTSIFLSACDLPPKMEAPRALSEPLTNLKMAVSLASS
eukprot:2403954-Rhodomonas_salina.2